MSLQFSFVHLRCVPKSRAVRPFSKKVEKEIAYEFVESFGCIAGGAAETSPLPLAWIRFEGIFPQSHDSTDVQITLERDTSPKRKNSKAGTDCVDHLFQSFID